MHTNPVDCLYVNNFCSNNVRDSARNRLWYFSTILSIVADWPFEATACYVHVTALQYLQTPQDQHLVHFRVRTRVFIFFLHKLPYSWSFSYVTLHSRSRINFRFFVWLKDDLNKPLCFKTFSIEVSGRH